MFLSVLLLTAGCGKKGPLLYPDMLIAQPPQQVSVEQSGSALRLSFELPTKDMSGRKLEDLEAVLVGRRVYQEKDCVSCQDQFQNLLKIDPALPAPAQRNGNRIVLIDRDVCVGERYQYRLQTVQQGGIAGRSSATAMTELMQAPEAPEFKVYSVFGGFVALDISSVTPQEGSLVGHTIWRAEGDGVLEQIATLSNEATHFEDQAVQRGRSYNYAVSTVVKRKDGVVMESKLSVSVTIMVADDAG